MWLRSLLLLASGIALPAAAQGAAGEEVYGQHCASCHGQNLDDGQFAPSLKDKDFAAKWHNRAALLGFVTAQMPPGQAGSLSTEEYGAVVDHILQANGRAPGQK